MTKENSEIANRIVNAWGMNDAGDSHAGDALRGRIEAALDAKDRKAIQDHRDYVADQRSRINTGCDEDDKPWGQ